MANGFGWKKEGVAVWWWIGKGWVMFPYILNDTFLNNFSIHFYGEKWCGFLENFQNNLNGNKAYLFSFSEGTSAALVWNEFKKTLHCKWKPKVLLQFCKNWIFPSFPVQTPDQKADSMCDAIRSYFPASSAGLCMGSHQAARWTESTAGLAGRWILRRSLLKLIFSWRCLFAALLLVCHLKIRVLPFAPRRKSIFSGGPTHAALALMGLL